MAGLIDFLVDNYLIFLLISLVLIFALIGYLIDSKKKETKKDDIPDEEAVMASIEDNMANIKDKKLGEATDTMKSDEVVATNVEEPVIDTTPIVEEAPTQTDMLGEIPRAKQPQQVVEPVVAPVDVTPVEAPVADQVIEVGTIAPTQTVEQPEILGAVEPVNPQPASTPEVQQPSEAPKDDYIDLSKQ